MEPSTIRIHVLLGGRTKSDFADYPQQTKGQLPKVDSDLRGTGDAPTKLSAVWRKIHPAEKEIAERYEVRTDCIESGWNQ